MTLAQMTNCYSAEHDAEQITAKKPRYIEGAELRNKSRTYTALIKKEKTGASDIRLLEKKFFLKENVRNCSAVPHERVFDEI